MIDIFLLFNRRDSINVTFRKLVFQDNKAHYSSQVFKRKYNFVNRHSIIDRQNHNKQIKLHAYYMTILRLNSPDCPMTEKLLVSQNKI